MSTGQYLDVASPAPTPPAIVPEPRTESNRFLGVQFECCGVYSRIYMNRARDAYVGHCPRCAQRVQFQIGHGGTDSRFFTVG